MSSFKSEMAFESIEMESFRGHVVWKESCCKTEKVFSILRIAEIFVRVKPSKTNIIGIV